MILCHGKQPSRSAASALAVVVLLLGPLPASAAPTETFKASTFAELDKGEPRGTLVSSKGEVLAGQTATRLEGSTAMVWCSTRGPDGTVYFGTGDRGEIWAAKNSKLRKVAQLGGVLVTSLAQGPGGKLLAGTMPEARILEVDPQSGKWRQLAKLPTRHVWALLWDGPAKTIYAASGSPGKIFALSQGGGAPRVYYDPEEQHLLCLKRDPQGALLAGSADRAILYRVTGQGKGQAVHDFDASELRDVTVTPTGTIYLAVNKFKQKTSGLPRYDPSEDGEQGTSLKSSSAGDKSKKKKSKVRAQELRPGAKTGKGAVYRLEPDGRSEQLFDLSDGYFTDIDLDKDGTLWVADGTKGKVYLIRADRTVLTAFDLAERQVLALAVSGAEQYLGTADSGSIYRVASPQAKPQRYLSEVFDAKYPARWGNLRYLASAPLKVASRSGNTSKPDQTWSSWREAKAKGPEVVELTSTAARYLQLQLTWPGRQDVVLRSFTAYYRAQNQRPEVQEITIGEQGKDKEKKNKTPKLKLKWKVENPDGDTLVYRLFYREEMGTLWRRISGPEPLEKAEYEWDTEPIPDGYYRLKVVASDERDNPRETALNGELVTPRLLIDNRRPEVVGLAAQGQWVAGMARDSHSPIRRIEYSLDGGPWRLVNPQDEIYDSTAEAFRFRLPGQLRRGTHVVAVRAYDEAENMGVAQIRILR